MAINTTAILKGGVAVEGKVSSALDRYFNTLAVTGYRKQSDVDRLLVFTFINDFLNSDTADFITEADYQLIDRALYCLYGSTCLIPYPEFINYNNTLQARINRGMIPRYNEGNSVYITEDGNVRFKDID